MIFSTIKGYPGYVISSEGEVYSTKYRKPRLLSPQINRGGYKRVGLCKGGKQRFILVHRLVAEAFIPNPSDKPYINHKDENKLNNRVDNLEWCTASENNNYGSRLTRIATSKKKKILQIDFSGRVVKIWDSQTDAHNALQINNICRCLRGKRKSCGGYIWRYADD